MANQSIQSVAKQLAEAHGRGDVQAARELLSPRLIWHMVGAPKAMGRDDYLKGMEEGLKGFSDMSITDEDAVAERDKIVVRRKIQVRHTGTFQGIPATNRTISFTSVWFYRIVDQTVVEAWSMDQDFLGMLR